MVGSIYIYIYNAIEEMVWSGKWWGLSHAPRPISCIYINRIVVVWPAHVPGHACSSNSVRFLRLSPRCEHLTCQTELAEWARACMRMARPRGLDAFRLSTPDPRYINIPAPSRIIKKTNTCWNLHSSECTRAVTSSVTSSVPV